MDTKRNVWVFRLLVLGVLAVGLQAKPASAQLLEGKFTLPSEVHWGLATLPAGDYSLKLDQGNGEVLVRVSRGLETVAFLASCTRSQMDSDAGAPPPLKVEHVGDTNVFSVERPDKFPLTSASEYTARTELKVTATVNPDIALAVPVVTLATGRVIEIKARLGDEVQKGQVLLRVQSPDISGAFSDY